MKAEAKWRKESAGMKTRMNSAVKTHEANREEEDGRTGTFYTDREKGMS